MFGDLDHLQFSLWNDNWTLFGNSDSFLIRSGFIYFVLNYNWNLDVTSWWSEHGDDFFNIDAVDALFSQEGEDGFI